MAKPLVVEFRGQSVNLTLEKVDRTKLYGYVETDVQDETGKRCELATLTADGHSIVGKGGSGLAYLSHEGLWRKKSDLKPVDLEGKPITPVKSSFDSTITLDKPVTIDDFLSHNIHLIYRLASDEQHDDLQKELSAGAIFQFPFSYRGGVEASAGFLLLGSDGNMFMCVGTPVALEYVGLKSAAAVVSDEAAAAPEEEDVLDFSLV
jgi:hypothetical protein